MNLGYVLLFGVVGVCLRFVLNLFCQMKVDISFPVSTLAVNGVGSFMMGVVYVLGVEKNILSDSLRVGLMTGFLGELS